MGTSIPDSRLIIATRGSRLALWQSEWVASRLRHVHPDLTVEIKTIRTTGDKLAQASLSKIAGKGVFTKELEEALLDGSAHIAVHSLKDLPTILPDGLHVGAIPQREDPLDALVVRKGAATTSMSGLIRNARIGTSSTRRSAQLRNIRPDLEIVELRGNVETRLRKLDEGSMDAIVLACAGLTRLGLADRITERIHPELMLPAPGQGALAIESRVDDEWVRRLLEPLIDHRASVEVSAERRVLAGLGGGCATPIAIFARAEPSGTSIRIDGLVSSVDGSRVVRDCVEGKSADWQSEADRLIDKLHALGAAELLEHQA